MALSASDIKFYYSLNDPGPANGGSKNPGDPQSDPNQSLGGCVSGTEIPNATLHNLFDVVTGDEASAGDTEYRCIFIKNDNASGETAYNMRIYISSQTSSPDTSLEIGLGQQVNASANDTCDEQQIANEDTAPTGVTFSAATETSPLNAGDINAGNYVALWVKWIVNAGAAAYDNDTTTITVKCDSSA